MSRLSNFFKPVCDSNHLPPFASEEKFITDGTIVEAREATEEDLLVVHTKRYLNRLKVTFSPANLTVFVNMKTLRTLSEITLQPQDYLQLLTCFL